ncbi:MAG: flagellar hook-associated protein FlgL [Candidatus Hinthialibacter antarcticus]|nr:flagellar hook-associated protein FlgL [Candidatus Hinthialibacter antarcticus]
MRVTLNMLNDRTLYNLQNNMAQVALLQEKLSTGRRINRAADDPVDFPTDLGLRASIQRGRSYTRNVEGAQSNLELTETTLSSVTDVLQQIRTLTVQGASDFDSGARLAIAEQIKVLRGEVFDLANANYNGQYIFGGSQTREQSFINKDGAIIFQGDDFQRAVSISEAQTLASNLTGLDTFIHSPNTITGSTSIEDIDRPLIEQIALAHPDFPNLPIVPDKTPGAQVSPSPNPDNYPGSSPNNLASFTVHGVEIKVDITVDSLTDVRDRINAKVKDVTATINDRNQLVIQSNRSDALDLQDGVHSVGFEPDPPQGLNLLGALGLHRRVENGRSLALGYPANNPLTDSTLDPTPARGIVRVENSSFLFAVSNSGPSTNPANPFGDNLSLTNVDENGEEVFVDADTPEFINDLEAIRITIDDDVIDIDLRALTQGLDFDGTLGNGDDVPGSTLEDLLELINNNPELKGRATAFINEDQTGIGFTAVGSTDVFKVENVRALFGRDVTTRVAVDAITGDISTTRTEPITTETLLADLPGALIDPITGSLGIRQPVPPPAGQPRNTNEGLISIHNDGRSDTIDLRDAETIQDVLDAFNDAKVGVIAEINPSRTGITVTSLTGSNEILSIVDLNDGTIARDLGLFDPPGPMRLRSDPGFAGTDFVSDVAPDANAGEFKIEVRDGAGATLETYSIAVDPNDTLDDIVRRIDEADGKPGPGGGLITANLVGGVINVLGNNDAHNIVIDPANDTTETDPTRQFTRLLGIDGYTVVTEGAVDPAVPYISQQNTASILGVDSVGVINEEEEHNVFLTLEKLELALRADNTEGITQALEDIDIDLEAILSQRTTLGARINRLENANARLQITEDFMREELSQIEDADLAELITDLTLSQNAFDASLQAAGRIVQQSLINFI